MKADPRWFQIFVLLSLLLIQQFSSDFSQNLAYIFLVLSSCILAELLLNFIFKNNKSLHSSMITGLSLSLLLRVGTPVYIVLAGLIAISSKRLIRYKGSHVYNPANLAVVCLLFFFPNDSWVAPGAWGHSFIAATSLALVGAIITGKVQRLDTTLSFLFFYLGIHGVRLLWLDDPMHLLFFRFNSVALIIFSFFMISDPKTTPSHILARVIFSALVAIIAFSFDAVLFERNGLFWGLAIASPTVIIFNYFFKASRYQWPSKV